MRLIRAYKETYGKNFGMFVFIAYLLLLFFTGLHTYERFIEDSKPAVPAIVLCILLIQFYFRNKVPNAVIGTVGLILSVITMFGKTAEEWMLIPPKIEAVLFAVISGILIGAYFQHSEI